jgi:hypothetical protein
MGHAGIVLGLEVSRLARNNTDWHRLLEICALAGTLILDEDGLYDPANFNDRLLLGLKGTMSEAELHFLKARLRGGVLSKARRGELVQPLPVGLVYNPVGNVVLDPDADDADRIRAAAVQRAQYHADLARRRYLAVDPANRLVADQLEAAWNGTLRELNDATDTYERARTEQTGPLSQPQRDAVTALASDFPALWNNPATPMRDRKRIARLLLADITLARTDNITVHIRLRGGQDHTLTLPLPLGLLANPPNPADVVSQIDTLLEEHTDSQIADLLTHQGLTSGTGQPLHARLVRQIREAYQLRSHTQPEFGVDPSERDRIQREHIQLGGVQQHVLARPGRPQLPVDPVRAIGDVPIPLRAQPERRMPLLQLLQHSKRRRPARHCHHVRPEPGGHSRVGPVDHHRPRRLRLPGVLDHHLQRRLRPALVHLVAGSAGGEVFPGHEARFTVFLEVANPSLDRAQDDAHLSGLRGVAVVEWSVRCVFRARLSFLGQPKQASRRRSRRSKRGCPRRPGRSPDGRIRATLRYVRGLSASRQTSTRAFTPRQGGSPEFGRRLGGACPLDTARSGFARRDAEEAPHLREGSGSGSIWAGRARIDENGQCESSASADERTFDSSGTTHTRNRAFDRACCLTRRYLSGGALSDRQGSCALAEVFRANAIR